VTLLIAVKAFTVLEPRRRWQQKIEPEYAENVVQIDRLAARPSM
jgi:hypothetical protein